MVRDTSRQSFLGISSDQILADARVGIVGLCGGGSHVAQQLAHIGIGNYVLCDPDIVESSNLNRMVGANRQDVDAKRLKVDVVAERILAVNSAATIRRAAGTWQSFANDLRHCLAVFGCVDSFQERAQLETICRRFLIPYFDIGMDVTKTDDGHTISGQVILSMPGLPCMRCIGFITDEILASEAQRYGSAGGRPQVVWPNGVLASTAIGLFMSTILPWPQRVETPIYMEYDGNAFRVFPSNRLKVVTGTQCRHFSGLDDLGDPFFGRPELSAAAKACI